MSPKFAPKLSRHLYSLMYRTGLKTAPKPKLYHRIQDARNVQFQEITETELPNASTSSKNKLAAFKQAYQISDASEKQRQTNINQYIKNRVAGIRPNYHPNENETKDIQRFLFSFSRRLKGLDKQIKSQPFSEKSITIEHPTLEFIYSHLLGQVFHINPADFSKNPVHLFQSIQKIIRNSLDKMLEEVDDLSTEFKSHHFLHHAGEEIKKLVGEVESAGIFNLSMQFSPYDMHYGVKPVSVY